LALINARTAAAFGAAIGLVLPEATKSWFDKPAGKVSELPPTPL
jgi:hypothetical protein